MAALLRTSFLVFTLFISMVVPQVYAAGRSSNERKNGLGLTIGNVAGVSFKRYLDKKNKTALDAAFSITDGKLHLTASYLWHDYDALPPPEEGELPLVYGATAGIYSGKTALGGVVGVVYIFKEEYPFDIFLHLLPLIIFDSSSVNMNFQGALGARYYFK